MSVSLSLSKNSIRHMYQIYYYYYYSCCDNNNNSISSTRSPRKGGAHIAVPNPSHMPLLSPDNSTEQGTYQAGDTALPAWSEN